MWNCKQVVEHSSDYLDRRLGLWARLQLRLHLIVCHHCRRYLRQLRATLGAVSGLEPRPREEEAKTLARRLAEAARKRP